VRERYPTLELVRIIVRASPRLALVAAALILLQGVLPSLTAALSGALIGDLISGNPAENTNALLAPIVGLAALFVLQQFVTMLRAGVCETVASRTRAVVTTRLMRAVQAPRTIAHMEDPAMLDLLSRARGRGWLTMENVALAFLNQQTTRLQGIAALVLIAQFQPLLAPLLFVGFLFRNYILAKAQQQMMGVSAQRARVLRGADYLRDLALQPPAAKELRVFGLSSWLVDRFEHTWLAAMRELWRQRPHLARMLVFGSLPLVVAACVSIGAMAAAVANAQVSIAQLMVYGQALAITFRTMGFFSGDENMLEEGLISLPPLLQLERQVHTDPRLQLSGTRSVDGLPSSEVRFEHVSFRYSGQTQDVLHDLNLCLPAGTSTAIVGDNGAGKTTLIKLLCRLYEPTGGRITVDGVPLTDFDAAAWQRRTATLFQDFQRYGLSAADNVGFGQIERLHDRAGLERAAEAAQASPLVANLPLGWDTLLSRQYTGGVDLSGGEWQRIAMARALFAAENAGAVLVLDEPTAQLDVRGEAAFYDHFLDLTRGKTTVIISHRFSTVRRADNILVLRDGHIVEQGSHAELMALDGRYAHLFKLQASRFDDVPS
jgi:ABC-type multidrug transport system fused ATPase/permease subunit